MAEPFSVASAAVGLADVAIRFGTYIQKLRKQAKHIDEQLEALQERVKHCENISKAIQHGFAETDGKLNAEKHTWEDLTEPLSNTAKLISKMERIVESICNSPNHWAMNHLDGWLKAHKLLKRDQDLKICYDELEVWLCGMNIILQRLDHRDLKQSQERTLDSLANIQSEFGTLQTQMSSLRDLMISNGYRKYNDDSLDALERLLRYLTSSTPKNVHFSIPQAVHSFFTGRREELEELHTTFIQPSEPLTVQDQRRFVIHGMAGSGKTQFCCKFADMNRYRFWGVFWVDGRSEMAIRKSFEAIARTLGRGATMEAAMYWLSSVEERWLLLIDNADDSSIQLEKFFPQARGGHILITTRSPEFKIHGNIGRRSYTFGGMRAEEASDLLLRASDLPAPWKLSWANMASIIADKLGFLVLAIIHAGAAIRKRLCELSTYPAYFDQQWEALRDHPTNLTGTQDERAVFASFEVCYEHLSLSNDVVAADAKDVLHIFAFLWREGLPVEILEKAMSNAEIESADEENRREENRKDRSPDNPAVSEKLKSIVASFLAWITRLDKEPPLPDLIRDGRRKGGYAKSQLRVRRALLELTQLSLVLFNDYDQTYTVHPLVHKWARERAWDDKRPKLILANQALWAELAGQVLAASILMPNLGTTSEVEEYHYKLYSHVEHVQEYRALIAKQMEGAQLPFWRKVFGIGKSLNADRIQMLAKFCVVYSQCGNGAKAEVLLNDIVRFLNQHLGAQHAKTRLATTALAGIYWELSKPEKAFQLQRTVVDTCERYLGLEHRDTFQAWNTLGRILWQQGKFIQAENWQRKAVAGLRALRENTDSRVVKVATLEAINDLGQTVAKFSRHENLTEAWKLFTEAIAGMEEIQHPRLSFAMENLARLLAIMGEELPKALELINRVVDMRKARNGKEGPLTLLALAGKAVVLSANGRLQEAERQIRSIWDIASRIFGQDHIAVLFARYILATIINHQGRHTEAEHILVDVSERQKRLSSPDGVVHPDRFVSLVELARCYQLRGKYERSIQICDEAVEGIDSIPQLKHHPYVEMLEVARKKMADLIEEEDVANLHGVTITFPEPCFKSSIL